MEISIPGMYPATSSTSSLPLQIRASVQRAQVSEPLCSGLAPAERSPAKISRGMQPQSALVWEPFVRYHRLPPSTSVKARVVYKPDVDPLFALQSSQLLFPMLSA